MNSKPKKQGRKFENVAEYRNMAAMQKGDSRFYAGKTPNNLGNIRRICLKLGMSITMRYVTEDPVTQETGTRLWCQKPATKKAVAHVMANSEDNEL